VASTFVLRIEAADHRPAVRLDAEGNRAFDVADSREPLVVGTTRMTCLTNLVGGVAGRLAKQVIQLRVSRWHRFLFLFSDPREAKLSQHPGNARCSLLNKCADRMRLVSVDANQET
jgi:hypothetical protein